MVSLFDNRRFNFRECENLLAFGTLNDPSWHKRLQKSDASGMERTAVLSIEREGPHLHLGVGSLLCFMLTMDYGPPGRRRTSTQGSPEALACYSRAAFRSQPARFR